MDAQDLALVDELTRRLSRATTADQRRAALEVVDALATIAKQWPALSPTASTGQRRTHAQLETWLDRSAVFGRLVRLTDDITRDDEPHLI